ncbi:ABC transporter ATP-binding protein [Silanimonas sp.]|uniref:ABC transporter ATP-binding protein n=1 Tax=Silanimonas sp. TaxID=1929290 RepID=UPI0025D89413|nr:ABC transporter ATP-binding protein [Silanimonas sp.]
MIEVENLTKDFHSESGDIVHALSGVSFSVKEGEFLAVEGPSGGGKSTLLAILGLLDKPSSGTYRLSGISVNELSFSQQAQLRNEAIGFVFQSFNLIGHLNVLKNVIVPLEYSRQIPKKHHVQLAFSMLEEVGLADRAEHMPHQLSGGQQQRVAIARALVTSPAVLLADEPTGNLDSRNADAIVNLLGRINEAGSTVIVVTHDQSVASSASRRLQIRDGLVWENA